MEFMEYLNEDALKEKQLRGHFLYIKGRAVLIVSGANLLYTKYKFYRLNDDIRDTIN